MAAYKRHGTSPIIKDRSSERARIITSFNLEKTPFTKITIGLSGVDPEIRLYQEGFCFILSLKDLRALDGETTLLNSADGLISCTPYNEGLIFTREKNQEVLQKIELTPLAASEFKRQLSSIKHCAEEIVKNKLIISTMYEVIVQEMYKIYLNMNCTMPMNDVFDEVYRNFRLYVSPTYIVHVFLRICKNGAKLVSPYHLFHLFDACVCQTGYMKHCFNIENCVIAMDTSE